MMCVKLSWLSIDLTVLIDLAAVYVVLVNAAACTCENEVERF